MKITGIKKAVGEHNNWLSRSPFYTAKHHARHFHR